MGIVGSTAPASGNEHAVSHLLEMALAQRQAPGAPHGMQVTVATRLALRVWQLVDNTIKSGAKIRVPDESSRRDDTELAFAELGAKTVEECWTGYSAKRNWLLAHQVDVEAMVAGWDAFMQTVTLPTPVLLVPGQTYTAAYHSTTGMYAVTSNGLVAVRTSGPLSTVVPGGAYVYGTGFPSGSSTASYGVDLVFVPSG